MTGAPHPRVWLLWGFWVVFLIGPLTAALDADASAPLRLATAAVVVAFGAVYVAGAVLGSRVGDCGRPNRRAVTVTVVLTALVLPTVPVLGTGALALLPFLLGHGVFALSRPWNWIYAGSGVAVALGVAAAGGFRPEVTYIGFVCLSVAAGAGAGRIMSDHNRGYLLVQDRLAVAAERERMARDLHDVLGQKLTAVVLKAELARRMVPGDPARATAELAQIQDLTRGALDEMRATVGGLRSSDLDQELDDAAKVLADAGIEADLPASGDALAVIHRPVAAWVVREAVTNVIRHSGAGRCGITIDRTVVRVSDDGRGVPDVGHGSGNGLRGLRERVELSGGALSVGPGPGRVGTVVAATW